METQPKFIKDFSKEESREERDQLAQDIRKTRMDHFESKADREGEASQEEQGVEERESLIEDELKRVEALEQEIAHIDSSVPRKLTSYFKYIKLKEELSLSRGSLDSLKSSQETSTEKLSMMKDVDSSLSPELQAGRDMLKNFYDVQKKKYAETPYTKEDIEANFTEEHLASLSIEDYTALLKRFPGEMVTHVTRQGVRDHTGMVFHTASFGEYCNGFKDMMEDKSFKSAVSLTIEKDKKDEAISDFLRLSEVPTKEEAIKRLNDYLNPLNPRAISGSYSYGGSFADFTAVHFACEEVADQYYGAEKGNEIFVTYPSAFIASQHYFRGTLNEAGNDSKYNDSWVWSAEEKGISTDAGIVFIPAEAKVNPYSGSQYEIDEKNRPIVNESYVTSIEEVCKKPEFKEFAARAVTFLGKFRGNVSEVLEGRYGASEKEKAVIEGFSQELSALGLTDINLQKVVLKYDFLVIAHLEEKGESEIKTRLEDEGLLFKKATETISSEEYWQKYFAENPDQKPSKMVFYKGDNPTAALHSWKRANGIENKGIDGFEDKNILNLESDTTNIVPGRDRFRSVALDVIEKYYAEKGALTEV